MTKLTATPDSFTARLIVARLGSDGIICELRGSYSDTYPVGEQEVWVERDRVDHAREILLIEDLESAYAPIARRPAHSFRVAALLVAAGLLMLPMGTIVRLVWG